MSKSGEQVVKLRNQDVNCSLISAVREGRLERARELINSFGLSYSQAWSEGYVLLCDAIINKHTAVAKLLLTSGSRVNRKNEKPSNTPLHFAAINGEIEIVELLLEHGADVNTTDNNGTSPLNVACEVGCLPIVEHLLNYGANVNCKPTSSWKQGYAPLHFAVEKGSRKVIKLLLSRGANVDVKGEDSITPLHIAAKKGYLQITEDLLNHGACTHSFTLKEGYTPLHFASELGKEEAVKSFLNKGADIDASTNGNLTPLHIATKTGHNKVVKLLLQHGAKVDTQDKDGKTTLYLAVEKGYLTIVEDVLNYCPDITDQSNRSSLKIAVLGYGEKYKKIVEVLLEYGFTVNPEDANNPNLLHAAVEKGYLKIIEDLFKYGANVNMLYNSQFEKDFTPLHSAAKNKQEEVANLLISYEAEINAQDKTGKTPIFYAIEKADLKITKLLLTNRANIKDCPDLLNIAVAKECIEIIEALLQHDADINASDKYGRTALHFTALSESGDLSGFFPHEDPDSNIKGEIAELLLSKGAIVDAQTKNGLTTLRAAILKGYGKVVEALLKYNANVNPVLNSQVTPLHLSVQINPNEEISTMLLNKGANVNAKQKDGSTALHFATLNGHERIVKVLLEYGAQVDSRDGYGRTALHIASQKGHVEVVVALLEYGSDINIRSENHFTPLDYAMDGIRWFYNNQINNIDENGYGYYDPGNVCLCEVTAEALKYHIVKMKTANLYVSKENLQSMCISGELSGFQDECEEEIARMKSEKINNPNISFYDILAKGTKLLAMYMRNENIVQVLKSDDYKTKFPIYASLIESHFKKGMGRKELLEQGNKISYFLFNNFPELPYDCTEKIFSYLSDEDLRILMCACKPLSISNPNTQYSY